MCLFKENKLLKEIFLLLLREREDVLTSLINKANNKLVNAHSANWKINICDIEKLI